MFVVPKKQQLKPFKNYQNSWGSAMAVWTYIWDKHLKQNEHDYMYGNENYERLWKSYKSDSLSECEKVCLTLTYDWVILKAKDFEYVSKMCIEFGKLSKEKYPQAVNHWQEIGEDLLKVPKTCYGVCFRWTSVTDMWSVYKNNQSRYYRLSDKKHYIYKPKQVIEGNIK